MNLSRSELRAKYLERAGIVFDTAVAVSSDGQKICQAKYVIIYSKKEGELYSARLPGAVFHQDKIQLQACHVIRRQSSGKKSQILKDELTLAMIGQYLAKAQSKTQILLVFGKLKILVVPAEDIPKELKPLLGIVSKDARAILSAEASSAREQHFRIPRCTDGRMCYCAPFDDNEDSSPRP